MAFTFHYFFAHLEGLQLFHENFTIENVFLVWLCKVFMMRISFFGLYVEANLVVYMMMDNLSKLVCINNYKLVKLLKSQWSTFKVWMFFHSYLSDSTYLIWSYLINNYKIQNLGVIAKKKNHYFMNANCVNIKNAFDTFKNWRWIIIGILM